MCFFPPKKISLKSLYLAPFRDKLIFVFYTEIQDGRQKWRKNNLGEKLPADCGYPGVKNLSCTVYEVKAFLCFTQKFKMAARNGGKTIFGKSRQLTQHIPCGLKISSKSLYLADFPSSALRKIMPFS